MSAPFTPSPHCANLKMMLRAKDDPGMRWGGSGVGGGGYRPILATLLCGYDFLFPNFKNIFLMMQK